MRSYLLVHSQAPIMARTGLGQIWKPGTQSRFPTRAWQRSSDLRLSLLPFRVCIRSTVGPVVGLRLEPQALGWDVGVLGSFVSAGLTHMLPSVLNCIVVLLGDVRVNMVR